MQAYGARSRTRRKPSRPHPGKVNSQVSRMDRAAERSERPAIGGPGPQDSGGLGVGSGDGESPKGTEKERARAPQIGGKGGNRGEGDQFPPDLVNDAFSAHQGPEGHTAGTEQDQPEGDHEGLRVPAALGGAVPSKKTPRNFCPSWAPWRKARAAAPRICPRRAEYRRGPPDPEGPGRLAAQSPAQQEERARPSSTRPQGPGRRLDHPPGRARAAPARPARRAWLSLVGMPKRQARAAQRETAARAAQSAAQAKAGSPPKSAAAQTVSATVGRQDAASSDPARLHPAADTAGGRETHRRPRLWRWHWAHRSIR